MAAKLLEIAGSFVRERQRFSNDVGDVIIGEVNCEQSNGDTGAKRMATVTIKGPADENELQPQLSYRFYGRWIEHERYGSQFAFTTFIRSQPHARAGVIRYLQQVGEGRGIGQARATALWNKFGSDAVRILRESPEVAAAAVQGLSIDDAQRTATALAEDVALESCTIDLVDLLGGRGFPKSTAKAAIKLWGNKAAERIQRDPFCLMAFRGCGFKKCDATYLALGLPPHKIKRQALSAWYALASDTEGHTWHPYQKAEMGIKSTIGGVNVNPPKALLLAKRGGAIATMRTDAAGELAERGGRLWVAEAKKARHEFSIAERLAEAALEESQWPRVLDDSLSDHQFATLDFALTGMVSLLGGSPGTGKTFAAAALIRAIIASAGVGLVAVAAPTGKAAVRITEAMAGYGIGLKARTIHSLLGVESREDRGGWGFKHCAAFPLPQAFIIVDESSMIDCDLLASLLAARAKGTHILFVGDVNQLPPVGHGAPLRDMIAAGLPYGELREIRRNSGRIVQACAEIRDGKPLSVSAKIDQAAGENLKMIDAGSPEAQIEALGRALEAAKNSGFNPVWDVQVLVPVNARSQVSRKALNTFLQDRLNKHAAVPGSPFRPTDKIVNQKNGWFPLDETSPREGVVVDENGKTFAANGELAEVLIAAPNYTLAKISSPTRIVKIPRGKEEAKSEGEAGGGGSGENDGGEETSAAGCTWDLGYALSVHKSQGSEWPMVLVLIDEYPGARLVCSREWVYTAISRAKKLCFLIGNLSTARGFCRSVKLGRRKTFLKELILRETETLKKELAQRLER